LPAEAVWFGEVSLAGEVRPVAHAAIRCREAAKLGFARTFGPAGVDAEGLTLLPNLVDRIIGAD
jgi:DNA repair protein RadA/Sms